MNEIAIISDIHGNYPALQAVLADIDKRKIDTVYCLGDLVGYYCMINEVVDEIRKRGIFTIMGNHDYALVANNGEIQRSRTCTSILKRQISYISADNFTYLKNLDAGISFGSGSVEYSCVHGGLGDNIDEYIRNIDEDYFTAHDFRSDVLVSGHTHVPIVRKFSKHAYLNPGSVGQPRDGDSRSAYIVVKRREASIVRVAYNIDQIVTKMKEEGYEDYISAGLYKGAKVGS